MSNENEIPKEIIDVLTEDQEAIQKTIDKFENQQALMYNQFAQDISRLMQSYSEACQVLIGLLRSKHGLAASEDAQALEEVMDTQTEAMLQAQAEQMQQQQDLSDQEDEALRLTLADLKADNPEGQSGE